MLEIIETYTLKPVDAADEDLVLQMRNQDFVRCCMANQDIISKENHHKWFQTLLGAHDKSYFIFLHHGKPAGVIGFFDIKDGTANWTLYLARENNPKGLGTVMCTLALEKIFKKHPVSRIETCVLLNNEKSLHLHKKLGFVIIGTNDESIELKLERSVWDAGKQKEN